MVDGTRFEFVTPAMSTQCSTIGLSPQMLRPKSISYRMRAAVSSRWSKYIWKAVLSVFLHRHGPEVRWQLFEVCGCCNCLQRLCLCPKHCVGLVHPLTGLKAG